jgi:hypothetical protein
MFALRLALNSTAGMLLVVALLLGLLNFPTTCACGVAVPHEHSLFLLHDHHHGHDGDEADSGTPIGSGDAQDADESPSSHALSQSGGENPEMGATPTLLGPAGTSTLGEEIALVLRPLSANAERFRATPIDRLMLLGTGELPIPDSPPPRQAAIEPAALQHRDSRWRGVDRRGRDYRVRGTSGRAGH